jgi:hypothetical protein
MGISFLYIGRDENTLKDRLPLDPRSDELPLELNSMSAMGIIRPTNSSKGLDFSDVLKAYGLPPSTDIATIVPGLPKGFNTSDPFIEVPLGPPWKTSAFDFSGWGFEVPSFGGFNLSNPTFKSFLDMFNGMAKKCLPSLPKDFKLSNIITQGGIVTSETDVLELAIYKDLFKGCFIPGNLTTTIS